MTAARKRDGSKPLKSITWRGRKYVAIRIGDRVASGCVVLDTNGDIARCGWLAGMYINKKAHGFFFRPVNRRTAR